MGAVSSISAMTIIEAIVVQAAQNVLDAGVEPLVLLSGNLDGADEHNARLLKKCRGRILLWY